MPVYQWLKEDESLMRIPDVMTKCVAFIQYQSKATGTLVFGGTVFFIIEPIPDWPGAGSLYMVTADHVIRKIKERSMDSQVLVRLNIQGFRHGFPSDTFGKVVRTSY